MWMITSLCSSSLSFLSDSVLLNGDYNMTSAFLGVGLGFFSPLYVLQMHADVDGEN